MKFSRVSEFPPPPSHSRVSTLHLSRHDSIIRMGEPPPIQSPSLPLSESLSSFSLSLPTSIAPLGSSLTSSLPLPPQSSPQRQYSKFERLPPELIEEIAFWLIRLNSEKTGPPVGLVEFLLISKRFEEVLNFRRNKGFYADLFKERFDTKGVERRWETVGCSLSLSSWHEQESLEELTRNSYTYKQMRNIEEKREKLLLLQTFPESKPSEEIHLNPSYSFTRPSSPTSFSLDNPSSSSSSPSIPSSSTATHLHSHKPAPSSSPWDPLTNRDYAHELVRRCQVLTKMRIAAIEGGFKQGSSRPASPRLMSFTPTRGRTKLNEPDELTQNLWTCYLMLLENGQFFPLSLSLSLESGSWERGNEN